MRLPPLTSSSLAIIPALLLSTGSISAQPLLSVDFQNTTKSFAGETQSGFQAFTNDGSGSASETRTFSTVGGDVDVTIRGHQFDLLEGFYNRTDLDNSGDLTLADLYEDFVFSNAAIPDGSESLSLSISGAGISPNTAYEMTFYSFDPLASQGSHTVSFDGASGTTGSAASISYDSSVNPTTDDQYATTGTFTSDGAGVLTIDLEDNWTGATQSTGIRLNGFVIGQGEPDTTFAITDIAYAPESDRVTLTWQSRPGQGYSAFSSPDLSDWSNELAASLGPAQDENPNDGDHITVTFPLTGRLENETDLFFRIEED